MAMNINIFMRKLHRYLSWPFVLLMVLNMILMNFDGYNRTTKLIINGTNLTITILLIISGLYLYYLPYLLKKKRKGKAVTE